MIDWPGMVAALTMIGPVREYGCAYCGHFIPIKRRDGIPFESDQYGYPLETSANRDLIYDIYVGHTKDCLWMQARRAVGDPNATA